MTPLARLIAFYLPQFHPIPENNSWWGPGFTEWTNVARARPLYRGHIQPNLPADLGFYDLRLAETRKAQADLARASGIEGFCYWHYWFGAGRRILERPFEEVLASGQPDFPFCLAWANQSWTGIWHGSPKSVLMEQTYPGRADEKAHFDWALRAFRDKRYMRVDGRPIFVVFAPHDLPSAPDFIAHWRQLAEAAGLPGLYFVAISNRYQAGADRYRSKLLDPFDAVTPLTPHDFLEDAVRHPAAKILKRLRERNLGTRFNALTGSRLRRPARFEYADVVAKVLNDLPDEPRFLPGVLPGWDNTPRSGSRGVVFENATPALFAAYLRKALDHVKQRPPQQAIIFLKAWNEWAEGNYIEPDRRQGHAFLDAVRSVMLPAPDTGEVRQSASRLNEPVA
jgi:lipopolysaccharide biosynthesis protein